MVEPEQRAETSLGSANNVMAPFREQADLDRAVLALVGSDARLAKVFGTTGLPELRRRQPGFAGLGQVIVGQQLSTASARAVWARLTTGLEAVDAETVMATDEARLGALGLSRAKIRTFKTVATEIVQRRFDLDELATLPTDAAHARLCALPGIGPWTAAVYLLFCLGHRDAWPAGDLAVQEAVRVGLSMSARPSAKEMIALSEPWRPVRGAAAHLWWAYYRVLRKRDGVAVETMPGAAAGNASTPD